jgi:hypothetical protein
LAPNARARVDRPTWSPAGRVRDLLICSLTFVAIMSEQAN